MTLPQLRNRSKRANPRAMLCGLTAVGPTDHARRAPIQGDLSCGNTVDFQYRSSNGMSRISMEEKGSKDSKVVNRCPRAQPIGSKMNDAALRFVEVLTRELTYSRNVVNV